MFGNILCSSWKSWWMALPLTPFRLIPAPRCRGGQFFWQLQLFGRVLPAPPIAGCQPSRGEAGRWASPINEGDKLTTNLGKEWQENHRDVHTAQEEVIHCEPTQNQARSIVLGDCIAFEQIHICQPYNPI